MSFLGKLKSDSKELAGPNVEKAPVREIDLSGTKLSFKFPRQTAKIPAYTGEAVFDINSDPKVNPRYPWLANVEIYSSGWKFQKKGMLGEDVGGLNCHIVLQRCLDGCTSENSLFSKAHFERWVCEINEREYGAKNKEKWENRDDYKNVITPERSFWRYPKSAEDIQWDTFNDSDWMKFEIFVPEQPPYIYYEIPISHEHLIIVTWRPHAYGGFNYFDPQNNLRASTKRVMDEIMSSMKVELSPEALRQYEEANSR